MSDNKNRPILYKGESYSAAIEKKRQFIPEEPTISYEAARSNLLNDISSLKAKIDGLPTKYKLPTETIVCLRFSKDYIAKTYYPDSIFNDGIDLEEVGSRIWRGNKKNKEEVGRIFFIRTTEVGLNSLSEKLNRSESSLSKSFKTDIRRVSKLDLLEEKEIALGFENWTQGRVEAILHPFDIDRSLAINNFKALMKGSGLINDEVKFKQYGSSGLTFISLPGNKKVIETLSKFNPLRTIHPLQFRNLPTITRESLMKGSPQSPKFKKKSSILVGVLDGGYTQGNDCLDKYVEIVDAVSGNTVPAFAEHGTLTTSSVLYGSLHTYTNSDTLLEPDISVRNFKVIDDTTVDPDLYCVIDAIEAIVPKNVDIQVYNLSLGPNGPILDDSVSRFTYACDILSKNHNILFCVAVGNDGEEPNGYDRIQSPSDIVNGIAVSAYTINSGEPQHAPYSCKGLGREGNKMKPDVSAFGGCERFPIQLLHFNPGHRAYTYGTSFASPQVAALCAKLIGGSKGVINPISARLLLTHTISNKQDYEHSTELGHGTLPDNIDNIMECEDKSYTLIYEGEVQKGKYREFEIPWVDGIDEGKANFHWTSIVHTHVDPSTPEDYTTSSIEINFCPNSKKYTFRKDGERPIDLDIEEDADRVKQLKQQGWVQSAAPKGNSTPKPYTSEEELRSDLKWDSVDVRTINKMSKGIKSPKFHVHAIGRGRRNSTDKVKFAIALTVTVPKAKVDIYQRVRSKYQALLPINMEIQARVHANNKGNSGLPKK